MPILSGQMAWLPGDECAASANMRNGTMRTAPPTFCVEYLSGFSVYGTMSRSSIAVWPDRLPRSFGSPSAARRRCRSRVDEALSAKTSWTVLMRSPSSRNGKFWNVIERRLHRADGTCVEIDRFYQTWEIRTRVRKRSSLNRSTTRYPTK